MDTNQTQQAAVPVAMLPIHTMEPKAEADKVLVFFRRKKVAETDMFRGVMVNSYRLPTATYQKDGENDGEVTVTDAEEVFASAISDAFMDAAGSILRRFVEEKESAKGEAKEAPESLFFFSAIITEMQAQQTSQRLNSDAIAAWYDASATATDSATRYGSDEKGKAKVTVLREKYLSLASNNPAIQPSLAVKMMAYINPEDTSVSVAKAVIKRLERLSKLDTADDL